MALPVNRKVGFIVMLSRTKPPEPRAQIAALAQEFEQTGHAHLLFNRPVRPTGYVRRQSPVAIVESGTHAVLAIARFDAVLDHETNRSLGHEIYKRDKPPLPKVWIRMIEFQRQDPPTTLEQLGWTIRKSGERLSRKTLPRGRAAGYFQVLV